eukprot:CAMPEP_0206022858 /NCGR_PEP_ID=MMETSP1464-20131121/35418_1 /ASSEMBLY_ACC=CAM_ASM_001124 /TAXON_ID=119497 /ORGANISM="Exanthemachrysis gayraliae, Strain RCC1523" /LENGTH=42 /DNA_ID= /DNA_START= /DNA_END= /DNA_ORIENTATION=
MAPGPFSGHADASGSVVLRHSQDGVEREVLPAHGALGLGLRP